MKPLFEAGTIQRALGGAAATLALAAAGSAGAVERQAYVSAHVGKNQSEVWPVTRVDIAGGRAAGAVGLGHALDAGLALGREGEKYRYELEYQRGRLAIESIARGALAEDHSAKGYYDTLMINGARLWRMPDSALLFAGLGAGWARARLPRLAFSNGCECFARANGGGWNYQARLGVEYIVQPGHAVTLQWNRLRLPGAGSDDLPRAEYDRTWVSVASLGYRYSFR